MFLAGQPFWNKPRRFSLIRTLQGEPYQRLLLPEGRAISQLWSSLASLSHVREGRKKAEKSFWGSERRGSGPLKTMRFNCKIMKHFSPQHLSTTSAGFRIITVDYNWESCESQSLFKKEFLGKPKITEEVKTRKLEETSLWYLQPQQFLNTAQLLPRLTQSLILKTYRSFSYPVCHV